MERMKQGEVTWTDLQSLDIEAQSGFYEALFGWTHVDMPTMEGLPDYRMFYKDGLMVAGGSMMSPDMRAQGMPSFWAVYLATPDVDAAVDKAVAAGGSLIMPAMDVLESGRMAAIADPTGGGIFLWQAKQHRGAETFSTPGAIAWADLATRDPEAAAAFFTGLFGWDVTKTEDGPMPYWQFNIGGDGEGGIMAIPDMFPADARPFWTIYFGTDDITASVARAQELGATLVAPPMDVGEGTSFAVLTDPAGATFALLRPQAA